MARYIIFRCAVEDRTRTAIRNSAFAYGIDMGTMIERLQRWYFECADTMEGTTDRPRSLDDLKKVWSQIFVEGE